MEAKLTISSLVFFLSTVAFSSEVQRDYSPQEFLRNYALSACLEKGFLENKEFSTEASAAAAGYFERGEYPVEAYSETRKIINLFLTKKYASKSGKEMTLMKCIDLSKSKEIDLIIEKYDPLP